LLFFSPCRFLHPQYYTLVVGGSVIFTLLPYFVPEVCFLKSSSEQHSKHALFPVAIAYQRSPAPLTENLMQKVNVTTKVVD
jgi:hypothetical protein